MSFENPTRLRIGMHANFGGKDYCVVGRSVLGEDEDGETYYWNEYNLETSAGEAATLVFDETERTSQWRLFTLFDPEYPMTAAEAATKSVGDRLNLTGDDVRVSFRGSSRVYYVEGRAPEGEEIGTEAEYFNALSGSIMQVVSWTGDEVEYYNGANLSPGLVASAFKLPQDSGFGRRTGMFSSFGGSDDNNSLSLAKFLLYTFLIVFVFAIVFGRGCSFSSDYERAPAAKSLAPSRPIEVGATGKLFDKNCRITGHTVMEIDEVGLNWERHEYELTDDNGTKSLLVCGDKPNDSSWTFYEPISPMIAPPATEAAEKKVGDTIDLDGFNGKVTGIMLSTIRQSDGYIANIPETGTASYGLRAANEYRTLLARWNTSGIKFFSGRSLSAKSSLAAFGGAK
jgi:hypothetical protein